jgi:dinuclear metal center YbgI/SA1388 family protein
MLAGDLVAPIEQFAPVCMQEKWDNCGFVVGDASLDVSKALIALDCTEAVIDEAIQIGADIVITHHPLIFGGVKKISTSNWLGRIIYKAIKNNIVIYCAHTNMDKAAGGVSGLMAEQLGLKNVSVLTEDGFGLVGDLEDGIECVIAAGVVYGEKGYDFAALMKEADERMYEDKKKKKKPGEEIR